MRLKLLFALLFFSLAAQAQNVPASSVDAFLHNIQRMKDDTVKVNAYLTRGADAMYKSERALLIFNTANVLAKRLNYTNGIVESELSISRWYSDRADIFKLLHMRG